MSATPPRKRPLLAVGNEEEWARINAEEREALTPPPDVSVGELLRRGQHLSAQAAKLVRAVEAGRGRTRS